MTVISDSGSMIDCIPTTIAKRLVDLGVCEAICEIKKTFYITFGKKGARVLVTKFISGAVLIDNIAVADEIDTPLLSHINFTQKGLTLITTNEKIIGVDKLGNVLFEGIRDVSQYNSLWQLDLIKLLQLPDPRVAEGESSPKCFSAKPEFTKSDVAEGRRIQRAFGNISFKAIGNTIEVGALRNDTQVGASSVWLS